MKIFLHREMQEELLACIRQAAMLPLTIAITESAHEGCTQLCVTAPVDSGGGGRPRVLYDVTASLAKLGKSLLTELRVPCTWLGRSLPGQHNKGGITSVAHQ